MLAKQRLFQLLIFAFTPIALLAQTSGGGYLPMLEDGRTWSILETEYAGCPELNSSDSTVDFSEVEEKYEVAYQFMRVDTATREGKLYGVYESAGQRALLREVQDSGRIYRFSISETLVIDMSLGLGDTIDRSNGDLSCVYNGSDPVTVLLEDSIFLTGHFRKRLGFVRTNFPLYYPGPFFEFPCSDFTGYQPIDTLFWIEGIGSTLGYFGRQCLGSPTHRLICLQDSNGVSLYSNLDSTYSCDSVFIDFPNFPSGGLASSPASLDSKECLGVLNKINHGALREEDYVVDHFDMLGRQLDLTSPAATFKQGDITNQPLIIFRISNKAGHVCSFISNK